jgi:hypothetical protein
MRKLLAFDRDGSAYRVDAWSNAAMRLAAAAASAARVASVKRNIDLEG